MSAVLMRPDPAEAKANPRAISTRFSGRDVTGTDGQRRHDLRIGRQPKYVDGARTELNTVLLESLTGAALKQLCEQRRQSSGRERKRAPRGNAAVSIRGIITFGIEAQAVVNEMTFDRQHEMFRAVADAITERLGTTLHGLVVHRDETAIHAHYQCAAVDEAGASVLARISPSDTSEIQTLVSEVAAKFDPRIERGHRKWDRIAAGADYRDTLNRSVKRLHGELPFEIAEKERELAELHAELTEKQSKLTTNLARLQTTEQKLVDGSGKLEKLEKRRKDYANRVASAEATIKELTTREAELTTEKERLEAEAQQLQEQVAAAEKAAADAVAKREADEEKSREIHEELDSKAAALETKAESVVADLEARERHTAEALEGIAIAVNDAALGRFSEPLPKNTLSPRQYQQLQEQTPDRSPTYGDYAYYRATHGPAGAPRRMRKAVQNALYNAFGKVAGLAKEVRRLRQALARAIADRDRIEKARSDIQADYDTWRRTQWEELSERYDSAVAKDVDRVCQEAVARRQDGQRDDLEGPDAAPSPGQ